MNEQIFVLSSQKRTTSHVLHLLLCFPTFGLWAIVWAIVASQNSSHNARIDFQMNAILNYKVQGLNDADTYHRVRDDEIIRGRKRRHAILIVLVVVALIAFIKFKL